MNSDSDLSRINHALGLASPDRPSEYDEGSPISHPHKSHRWSLAVRWLECDRCGQRDYWPGGARPCLVRSPRGRDVALVDALAALAADLRAFGAWWSSQDHPDRLPSVDEWAANFLEWRISR